MTDWDHRALAVLDRLQQRGHQAVLVGGCVRDSLLSVPPHDYDAATSALPEEIKAACADLHCIDTGAKHGTVTVLSQGLPVEVTTFRRESGYTDHRRPDKVEFTQSLTEDLARRDFTINAMAWAQGQVMDPFGGQQDLQQCLIRCVGDPERRFEEDALRVLRGLRLSAQLSFAIHPATDRAIRRHIPQLSLVAWERICTEFLRLLCSPGAAQVLLAYPEATVQIIPELDPTVHFQQHSPHHIYDVYTHSVKAAEALPPQPALRLAALLHDVGKPAVFSLDTYGCGHFYHHPKLSAQLAHQALERLRTEKSLQERVVTLVERHHLPVEASRKWVGRWLSRLGQDVFFDLLALERADGLACAPSSSHERLDTLDKAEALAQALVQQAPCLTLRQLAVNGRDAMAAGLSGREIGTALHQLLEQVAEGTLSNDRERLLPLLSQLRHTDTTSQNE